MWDWLEELYNIIRSWSYSDKGKFLVLGASQSGKSTLLTAAQECFEKKNEDYGCEKPKYKTHATGDEPKDKWGSGRRFITVSGHEVTFYFPADFAGNPEVAKKNVEEYLPGTQTICWCYDVSKKEIPIGDGKEPVSLKDYVHGSVNWLIKEMTREDLKEHVIVRNIIFLGTHIDKRNPRPDSETLKKELGYDQLRQIINAVDGLHIRTAFACGSFISYQDSFAFWEDIIKQLSAK